MIKDLHRKGVSISQIARLTGHDRKTIRHVIDEPLAPAPALREPKARKIDPYVPFLQRRMEEGVLNARKLYQEIQEQGYPGKERQVRAFVHPFREEGQRPATVRFETEPGQQAQVDWGHFGLIDHQGRQRRLYGFVMTLGWSRAMYLEFTVSADVAWFLRCHVHAFHYFGGVPRQILHDNLKTAVLDREANGTIHWNPRYLDFAQYYGFTPCACQPYRAQTKGKVESGIKYVRGNFWLGLKFTDLADLNRQGSDWINTIANVRLHGTTGEVPFTRLAREGLQPLADKPDYDTSLVTYRRSTSDCLLSYEGNYYSVPAAYAKRPLLVKETERGEIIVFNPQGEEIARHRLVEGHNQRVIVAAHYQGLSANRRPVKRPTAVQIKVPESELAVRLAAPSVEIRPLTVYEQLAGGASCARWSTNASRRIWRA
jgi:transposase